jgi:putative hydrolase of the HAD superfamily
VFEAVLFSLENTLTDYRATLHRVAVRFREVFEDRLEHVTLDQIERTLRVVDGGGYRPRPQVYADVLHRLPWFRAPNLEEMRVFWEQVVPRCTQPRAHLHPTLEAIRQHKLQLGIITNGTAVMQNALLDTLQLRPLLDVIIISEVVGTRKPDPVIFNLAVNRLGVSPANTLFVGDHPLNDILGAHSANLTPVWMSGGYDWPGHAPEPEFEIHILPELLPLVKSA